MPREERISERRVVHTGDERSWSPAQILALVIGVIFMVFGGVALLRTGVGESVFEPTTTVAGLRYTPLLGMIEVAFGLLLLAVGAFPHASDGVVFLGILALAFGLLLVIEPTAFQDSIAAGQAHGWFYVLSGGAAALTGLISPSVMRRRAEGYYEMVGAYDRERERDREREQASERQRRPRTDTGTETRRIGEAEEEHPRTSRIER